MAQSFVQRNMNLHGRKVFPANIFLSVGSLLRVDGPIRWQANAEPSASLWTA